MFGITGENMTMRMRMAAFRNILRQDVSYFDDARHSTGKICTRLATDAPNIRAVSTYIDVYLPRRLTPVPPILPPTQLLPAPMSPPPLYLLSNSITFASTPLSLSPYHFYLTQLLFPREVLSSFHHPTLYTPTMPVNDTQSVVCVQAIDYRFSNVCASMLSLVAGFTLAFVYG
jgi:ABC-type multidrug transport system fused ATPase/permease subunit